MSQLLRYFPLGDIGHMRWPTNLIAWMQDVHRAVSGDYNVIHLAKGTTTTDAIGGAAGTVVRITWDDETLKQPGFVHSNTDNPSAVFVENAGRYSVRANIVASNGALAAVQMKAYIKKNGAEYFYGSTAYDYAIGSGWKINLQINTEIDLDEGDYIEVETYVVYTGGQAVTTSPTECEFIVRRMA